MNKILAWLAGLLGVILAVFKVKNERLQRRSAERDAEIAKASEKATSDATDALTEGLENEAKPITRGHFDNRV